AQSASDVHSMVGSLTQCLVDAGPREQSRGPVPKLATSVVPSGESRMVVAFSGTCDGGMFAAPPPMLRQPAPRSKSFVPTVSESISPEKGGSAGVPPGAATVRRARDGGERQVLAQRRRRRRGGGARRRGGRGRRRHRQGPRKARAQGVDQRLDRPE